MMVFVFENLETGDFHPIDAPNESAARLQLGDLGTDIERTKLFRRCEFADLPKLIEDVLALETDARQAARPANSFSIGKASFPSMEDVAKLSADQTKCKKLKTLREQLSRIDAGR